MEWGSGWVNWGFGSDQKLKLKGQLAIHISCTCSVHVLTSASGLRKHIGLIVTEAMLLSLVRAFILYPYLGWSNSVFNFIFTTLAKG